MNKIIAIAIAIICVSPFGASALEKGHFNANNLTEPSNVNLEILEKTLEKRNLQNFAEPFIKGEEEYGANVFLMLGIGALESDWYRQPAGAYNYHGNMGKNGALNFASLEQGIMSSCKNIGIDYLTPKGKFYKGVSLAAVNPTYCPTDVDWKYKVAKIASDLRDEYNVELEKQLEQMKIIFEESRKIEKQLRKP